MSLDSDALRIALAGVRAVDPARAVREAMARPAVGRRLGGVPASVHLVALGKAARAMVEAASEALGSRSAGGVAVVREPGRIRAAGVTVIAGSHPMPTAASFHAGETLLRYVSGLSPSDRVVFLISGGGSSLAEAPAEGLGLSAVRRTTETLLASGAPIQAMNVLRRHLSAVKGGRLAAACRAGRWLTLAISDVVGDGPQEIASGPTVGDPTTFADALAAVDRYRLADRLPQEVVKYLRDGDAGRHPETVKPDDPRLALGRFRLVATNRLALEGAVAEARSRGYRPVLVSGQLTGETASVAEAFAQRLRAVASGAPVALLGGGETTVTLNAKPGRGGRNQEFVLAAASTLRGFRRSLVLSLGTDGIDGPTDAAGGWVDDRTMGRADGLGIDLGTALRRHDTYEPLDRLGGLLRTGPTGTNVMDLHVGLARPGPTTNASGPSGRMGRTPRRSASPASRRRRS
jgi:glycerate 2-kinase